MPKRRPKRSQYRYQNSSNIYVKTSNDKNMKIIRTIFFWCIETYEFNVKSMSFEGLAGSVRERKRYQTKVLNNIYQNASYNRWKNDAESMLERTMQAWKIYRKRTRKGNLQPSQINKSMPTHPLFPHFFDPVPQVVLLKIPWYPFGSTLVIWGTRLAPFCSLLIPKNFLLLHVTSILKLSTIKNPAFRHPSL